MSDDLYRDLVIKHELKRGQNHVETKSVTLNRLTNLEETLHYYLKNFMLEMIDQGVLYSRGQLKKMDTIDFSMSYDLGDHDPSALPACQLTPEDKEAVQKNWYLVIPPLKEGVVRINKSRYFYFVVSEISEEDKSYTVEIWDYAQDGNTWLLEVYTKGDLKVSDGKMLVMQKQQRGLKLSQVIEAVLLSKYQIDEDDGFLGDVIVPYLKSLDQDEDIENTFTSFCLAIIKTNIQLMSNRPKAIRTSTKGAKVKVEYGEAEKNPKPQIVRAIGGGINIKSVKVPRVPCEEVIRHYRVASWKTRGYVRKYKTGKMTYVRPSIHHRKCLENSSGGIPQTIIQVMPKVGA